MNQQRCHLAYLLRLWQESGASLPHGDAPGDPAVWRASLESSQSDECKDFAGLEELFAFLRERTAIVSPTDGLEKGEQTPKTSAESGED